MHASRVPARRRRGQSRCAAFAAAVVALTAHARAADHTESPAAFELVLRTVQQVAPPELRGFLDAHADAIRQQTLAMPSTGDADAAAHFIMLDAGADADPAARLNAIATFPQDRRAALALFAKVGLRDGGTLPWTLLDEQRALEQAFVRGAESEVLHAISRLVHFCTDAALPFNTTVHPDGPPASLRWNGQSLSTEQHRTARDRLQVRMMDHLRDRLSEEVRVWPQRVRVVPVPEAEVFATLRESARDLDPLLAIDAEVMASLGITEAAAFAQLADEYYLRAGERAAPILEERLEAGALLAASLLTTAWTRAGRPDPARLSAAPEPTSPTDDPAAAPNELVASRTADKFHRPTCRHVERIAPDNLVRFDSLAAALATGRTPCKVCKPDQP